MASQQVLALLFKVRILTWDHTTKNLLEIQLCDIPAEYVLIPSRLLPSRKNSERTILIGWPGVIELA